MKYILFLIRHFHISHNTLFSPPKFPISIVLNSSWDDFMSQEKLKTMLMVNLWRQTNCITGDEVANLYYTSYHLDLLRLRE